MPGETLETCTAGAGTLLLEFGVLSRLSGSPIYEVSMFILNFYQKRIGRCA